MKIQLKSIAFVNFKGIQAQKFQFDKQITTIGGKNGTGKTTIFDGFIWCLFGKDSQDRKQFAIKTVDKQGNPFTKLPHEVEVELIADNQTIRLRRTYTEKWQKKRGAVEEEFTGHEECRYYNDVPLSVAEYQAKINDLCKEDVFKMITNPHYFLSQKDDVIRTMLFRMAGDVTPEEITKGNTDLAELLDKLQGKSIEDYRREVLAQTKRIKDELKAIPIRIEEVKRNMPEERDTQALRKQYIDLKTQIGKLEQCSHDASRACREANEEQMEKLHSLADAENELQEYEFQQRLKAQNEYRDQCHKQKELKSQEDYLLQCIETLNSELLNLNSLQHECDNKRSQLLAEFKAIQNNELVFDENMFVCPTCKRPFDSDDIEARKQEMIEHFNEQKAEHLKQINAEGTTNNERKFKLCKQSDEKEELIDEYNNKIQTLKADPIYSKDLSTPPTDDVYKTTDKYKELVKNVEFFKPYIGVRTPLNKKVEEYKKQIDELYVKLETTITEMHKAQAHDDSVKRVEELQHQLKAQNEELATYEREEYRIQQYQKIRATKITDKINNLFVWVSFKLFETQINGGEVECCKALIDGVPYADANNAAKINAGLDIIDAICKYEDITAPIFIDNAESVNELKPTKSQQIRLAVTTDDMLKEIK